MIVRYIYLPIHVSNENAPFAELPPKLGYACVITKAENDDMG